MKIDSPPVVIQIAYQQDVNGTYKVVLYFDTGTQLSYPVIETLVDAKKLSFK